MREQPAPMASDANDPGCVKTHTVAKCRKNNSPGRHHASRVQYDLTLKYAIPSRSFYARSKGWSFYTAKTGSGHEANFSPRPIQNNSGLPPLAAALSRAQEHPTHGAVHRNVARQIQGFLAIVASARQGLGPALGGITTEGGLRQTEPSRSRPSREDRCG